MAVSELDSVSLMNLVGWVVGFLARFANCAQLSTKYQTRGKLIMQSLVIDHADVLRSS